MPALQTLRTQAPHVDSRAEAVAQRPLGQVVEQRETLDDDAGEARVVEQPDELVVEVEGSTVPFEANSPPSQRSLP